MACPHRAMLIYTRNVRGTASDVAAGRVQLSCSLEEGHAGEHHDTEHDERWKDRGDKLTHVFRDKPEA